MTIEIHNPELERLLQERLEREGSERLENELLEALRDKSIAEPNETIEPERGTLLEFLRRSPLVGLELELGAVSNPAP